MVSRGKMEHDVIIIGGGQSGLAVGYYLQKSGANFVILDAETDAGGAWQHTWDSLRLFSAAEHSSLPGMLMPPVSEGFPPSSHVIDYLGSYERRYSLPIQRPARVESVVREDGVFRLETSLGGFAAAAVISATGTWSRPFIPAVRGAEDFAGGQIHSAQYRSPEEFAGRRVAVVGGGNSGAQIVAEVSRFADTLWITEHPPRFLPDGIDGRHLFARATETARAVSAGEALSIARMLGSIVVTPPVAEARARGDLQALPPFSRIFPEGAELADGRTEFFEAIIWCTGFRPALGHLRPLGIFDGKGRIATDETRALTLPGLWLVGYGGWTGYASATLIGVGRTAKAAATQALEYLGNRSKPQN